MKHNHYKLLFFTKTALLCHTCTFISHSLSLLNQKSDYDYILQASLGVKQLDTPTVLHVALLASDVF